MSQFACSADGLRIKGSASTAYAALVNGSYSHRRKFRFCADHGLAFRLLADDLATLMWIEDASQHEEGALGEDCACCDQYGPYTLFLDLFLRGEPSRAYRAKFCDAHVGPVAQKVSLEP